MDRRGGRPGRPSGARPSTIPDRRPSGPSQGGGIDGRLDSRDSGGGPRPGGRRPAWSAARSASRPDARVRQGRRRRPRRRARRPRPPPSPPSIGSIDMDTVFKGYDKVKVASEEFKADAMAKTNELMKLPTEAKQEQEKLAKLTPGSLDAKKNEDQITQLKAQIEAGREQRRARVRPARGRDASPRSTRKSRRWSAGSPSSKGMTYVVQVSERARSPAPNPNSAMMAIEPDRRLRRPAHRHHQRRDLLPEPRLQGQRRPGPQGHRAPPPPRPPRRRPPADRPAGPAAARPADSIRRRPRRTGSARGRGRPRPDPRRGPDSRSSPPQSPRRWSRQGHAHRQASAAHDRPRGRGPRGRLPPRARRRAAVPARRGRRRASSSSGPTCPSRPTVPAHIRHVIPRQRRTTIQQRRGDRRDGRARHGRPRRPPGRQLRRRDRRAPRPPAATGRAGPSSRPWPRPGIVEQDRAARDPGHRPAGHRPRGGGDPHRPPRRRPTAWSSPTPRLRPRRRRSAARASSSTSRPRASATSWPPSRTFLLEAEAEALRKAGIGSRTTERRPADLRPRRGDRQRAAVTPTSASGTRSSTWSATSPCSARTSPATSSPTARATSSTPRWSASCSRPSAASPRAGAGREPPVRWTSAAIMKILPHRYPFLLVDRVLELEPGRRVVALKNVSLQRAVLPGPLAGPADHAGRPDRRGAGPGGGHPDRRRASTRAARSR